MYGLFKDLITEEPPKKPYGIFMKRKSEIGYTESDNKFVCCKTCWHRVKKKGNNKHYNKCWQIGISDSEASDIKIRMVCRLWKERS